MGAAAFCGELAGDVAQALGAFGYAPRMVTAPEELASKHLGDGEGRGGRRLPGRGCIVHVISHGEVTKRTRALH